MRALFVIILFAAFVLPPIAFAEVQTFTATHTYVLGDHDSKDDARQRCLLEAKRKILEQAGVYIESASEVKNFDLTKDTITSFAAAVMQVKDTKEAVSFQQGHMTMTLKLTAKVDLAELRKHLAASQVDASVRDDVAAQKERLKSLESQLEAMMQRQQGGQSSGHAPTSPPINISAEDLQRWHAQAAQGYAKAQHLLGLLFANGNGVPQDYVKAGQWWEKAAAQGNAEAQAFLGGLYRDGRGVTQDHVKARLWYEKAAAKGNAEGQFSLGMAYDLGQGVPQDYTQAAKWYEKAATQGNVMAQFLLGLMYDVGHDGAHQDYVRVAKWYEKAAAQGHDRAQFLLGELYRKGEGVPQDYTKAQQWFEKAAAQGDMEAQFNLGIAYQMGDGVPKDATQAAKWYEKAAVQGHKIAQDMLAGCMPTDWVCHRTMCMPICGGASQRHTAISLPPNSAIRLP